MGKDSMVLRDLLASVTQGTTINVAQTTATDLLRAVIRETDVVTPWSNSAYTYEISGYTVSQSVGVLYNFYVNTGATLKTLDFLATGDTALTTYISGSTLTIPSGITVTEIETVTTGTTTTPGDNYLQVNVVGLTGGTTGSSFTGGTVQDLNVSGTLSVHGSSGTGGWTPIGSLGNGIALAGGIVTSISFPTWPSSEYITESPIIDTTGVTGTYYRCSGATNFHLPESVGNGGWILVKNIDGASVTIYPLNTDTIDYAASKALNSFDSLLLIDGSIGNWDIN